MGIFSGIKNKVRSWATKKYDEAGNKLVYLSKMPSEQIAEVEKKRIDYLTQMPSSDDPAATELTARIMAAVSVNVFNSYLPQIKDVYLVQEENASGIFDADSRIKYIEITKWVTDSKESSIEKLINIYESLSEQNSDIALVFNRTVEKTRVFLGVVNIAEEPQAGIVSENLKILCSSLRGNFPGSEFNESNARYGVMDCFSNDRKYSVSAISNIPSEKSEKFISQTMEKLLDGVVPDKESNEYTVVLIASPIKDIESRKNDLGQFYTGLSPYASWQTNFTFTQSDSSNSVANFGLNAGMSAGVQAGRNQGVSSSHGETQTNGTSVSDGTNESRTSHQGQAISNAGSILGTAGKIALMIPGGQVVGAGLLAASGITKVVGPLIGDKTTGKSHTEGSFSSYGVTDTTTSSQGTSNGLNAGGNLGANFARSSSITVNVGKNEGITQSFTNYNIRHLLEHIEMQMKRLDTSSALGMWDFAAYVLSEDSSTAVNVAHNYLSLSQGENSYLSNASVNTWHNGFKDAESDEASEICKYITTLRHPVFALSKNLVDIDPTFLVYPLQVTPTTALSGKELAYSLNFPAKSVAGFPVLECASFGRNISTYDAQKNDFGKISIGKIFHMNHPENLSVKLSLKSLCSHTFITGSTGSGKSNTIYKIISGLIQNDKKFLIIEPAKGEYKHIFGNIKDVAVYGTNQKISKLLKINPFSFPSGIHILEHLDRLVEIFNVCWPMYAAMPAVLKEAVEKSYEDAGWDLTESINRYGNNLYPTFTDVTRNIKTIIDSSDYDAENKGAYKGSLVTRLKSLTNGINGQIFTTDSIADNDLFDENVIIDLSRVGSSETKSLIMGLLVLKLQEYRMSQGRMNADLNHITVLEEAHNLLKRTSAEVSSESANLLGKSVEMLTNAIAEMRTYGEGFIIADQAPALLDMAVIRNTNTKIIMRLPDLGDRELVGKAANLNEDQIIELAKLPCGVAAVYQNEWVQPVLCKVDYYPVQDELKFEYQQSDDRQSKTTMENRIKMAKYLCRLSNASENIQKVKEEFERHLTNFSMYKFSGSLYVSCMQYIDLSRKKPDYDKLAFLVASLLPEFTKILKDSAIRNPGKVEIWRNDLQEHVEKVLRELNMQSEIELRNGILQCILQNYILGELNKPNLLNELLQRKTQQEVSL